jgi:hypothetical protein
VITSILLKGRFAPDQEKAMAVPRGQQGIVDFLSAEENWKFGPGSMGRRGESAGQFLPGCGRNCRAAMNILPGRRRTT